MKLSTKTRRENHEKHLIPLINIVFLLLIFFMLVGRLQSPDVLLVDPLLANSEQPAEPEALILIMAADGRLAIAERVFALERLGSELAPKLAADPTSLLTLKADANAPAEKLLDVLDALQALGVEQLTLLSATRG